MTAVPKPEPPLRVAVLSELPTPYRWPLFRRVAERAGLDLTVIFYSQTEADRDWGLDVAASTRPRVEFPEGRAYHVRGRRSLYFHWNPGIRDRLAEGAFDVVVIPGWSMPSSLAAVWTCRRRRIPYVIFSETNDLSPRPAWLRLLKRVVLRPIIAGASAWLATGTMSERFLHAHGARPERIHRFANTPDVATLRDVIRSARSRRVALRAELGIPESAPLAIYVGRLIGAKDVRTLVDAHGHLEAHGSPLWTLVVGDGVEAESLRAEAAARRMRHIVFAGAKRPEELPELWAVADLFVLPSIHEPWGVVVNEAMAAGLPIVLSDRVGAGADLLVEGETGRGFPAGDPAALAVALTSLVDSPTDRRRMGRAAEARVAGWGYEPSVDGFEAAVRAAAGSRA